MTTHTTASSYSAIADRYDDPANETSFWGRLARQAYERMVLAPGYQLVVDVGCGSGLALEHLAGCAPASVRFVGIEPAEQMRVLAAQRTAPSGRVAIRDGRFEALPLADASVDYLYSLWAMHWVSDARRAAAELRRVMKREGEIDLWFVGLNTGREFAQATAEVLKRYVDLETRLRSAAMLASFDRELVDDLFAFLPARGLTITEETETHWDTLERTWAWQVRSETFYAVISPEDRPRFDAELRAAISALGDHRGIPYTRHSFHVRYRHRAALGVPAWARDAREREESAAPGRGASLCTLAAGSDHELRAAAVELAATVEQRQANGGANDPPQSLQAVGRRGPAPHRAAVVFDQVEALARDLRALGRDQVPRRAARGVVRRRPVVAFLFSGQGAELAGAGRELFATSPVFRAGLEECARLAEPWIEGSLVEILFHDEGRLRDDIVNKVALVSLQYTLANLWRSWGVTPSAVAGHSLGEYAAACVAGVLSLPDAIRLVIGRGQVMRDHAAPGAMCAVQASPEAIHALLASGPQRIVVSAINAPESLVLSGDAAELQALAQQLAAQGIKTMPLATAHAFHSPLMRPAAEPLRRVSDPVHHGEPLVPFVSTVAGGHEIAALDGEYWVRHMLEPVQFMAAIDTLERRGTTAYIEIGPGATLTHLVAQRLGEDAAAYLPSLHRDEGCWTTLLHGLAALHAQGVDIDWDGFAPRSAARVVPLSGRAEPRSAGGDALDAGEAHGTGWAQQLGATTAGERLRVARGLVLAEVEELLGAKISAERVGLKELGLRSVQMVALARRLSHRLDRRVPETIAFSRPNVDALARFVLETLALEAADDTAPGARARARAVPGAADDPIAIVGIACRTPGGIVDPEGLWQLLEGARDTVQPLPADRRSMLGGAEGLSRIRASVVDGVAEFDAGFFRISPREARRIDPTYRLLLEVCWEALERAAIVPASLEGSDTGLFIGIGPSEYDAVRPRASAPVAIDAYSGIGTSPSIAVGRISYVLGLHGPALAVDTACSSSLVALHLACQSLRSGECSAALAGGASLILSPGTFAWLESAQALAADGRCKTFSADADGYGRGEGCAVVVVKRLSRARADGDRIWAVIRGSAVNHDGASSGLTVPNGRSQEALLRRALDDAGCSAASVGYVEAHGTGTPLGDPIEVEALRAVYGHGRTPATPLVLGSVKTNLGHLEYAAGVAGLLKVVLALQHARIPAHRHAQTLTPRIAWDESPVAVPRASLPWPAWNTPRRAGVSSFGLSGTNAHVIVEQAPPDDASASTAGTDGMWWPVLLSARTEGALRGQAERLRAHLARHPQLPLIDLAYSLATTRSQFEHRAAITASDRAGLLGGLDALVTGSAQGERTQSGKLAVLFTGQGSQHVAMGRDLHERYPAFRAAFDAVCARLDAELGAAHSLRDVMRAPAGPEQAALFDPTGPRHAPHDSLSLLDQTAYAEGGLFALEVALFRLCESWGVRPDLLLGHAIGELVCAHVSGVLSLDDACRLVGARARLMQALPAGERMVAGQGTEAEVPDDLLGAFAAVARTVAYRAPSIPIVSSGTGKLVGANELGAAESWAQYWTEHWIAHVRHAVRWVDGVRTLHAEGARTFLELGPRGGLTSRAQDALPEQARRSAAFIAGLRTPGAEPQTLTAALGALHVRGHRVDWQGYFAEWAPARVALPTYAFQRERYWVEPERVAAGITLGEPLGFVDEPLDRVDGQRPPRIALRALDPLPAADPVPAAAADPVPAAAAGREPAAERAARTIQDELTASLAEVLYMDAAEVDPDRPFVEMGFDSILGVEWTRKLNERYGIALSATKLYAYPTIHTLSGLLRQLLPARAPAVTHDLPAIAARTALDAATPHDSTSRIEGELTASLAEALYMATGDVDPDRPFVEMGLDSIIGVEWTRALNQRYGIALSATKLYEYPTIRALSGLLGRLARPGARAVPQDVSVAVPMARRAPAEGAVEARPERRTVIDLAPVPDVAPRMRERAVEPIAIIGMSGRYPGAADLATYWQNLAEGKNSVEPIPASRWKIEDYYDPQPGKPGKIYCTRLGRLDDVECFDPRFFQISPAEAQTMDPQQRLFLEEAYKAFQDAGYSAQRLNRRNCGVYLGMMTSDYALLLHQAGQGLGDNTGNSAAIAAARIAYHLNLKGPAIPIDTACSGSLVATHLACQALRAGEVEMALVGGVTVYLAPQSYIAMCTAGMLSPDGQCKTFDNSADGFVPGEGVGALVLKRLGDAEADGDRIHGVIIGSGINQDGKTNGITAPSLGSQVELVREIYTRHDIHPESISYVEMHGTGTKLGDPIELEALATAYRERTQRAGYCAIGSVKSNIGHTSAAAGVAGVHKVLLALQHGELPATLNFHTPNEHFDFAGSPFRVNTERSAWPAGGAVRRAAVSSFGFSGTNAHLVIEEYRTPPRSAPAGDAAQDGILIVLSARSEDRLKEQARRLRAHVERTCPSRSALIEIAHTLQVGRDAMEHRLAVVVGTTQELVAALTGFLDGRQAGDVYAGRVRKTRDGGGLADGDADASAPIGEVIAVWIRERQARKLAHAWVRGCDIDWSAWYGPGPRPRPVSLPTYAFARERYWPSGASAPAASAPPPVAPVLVPDLAPELASGLAPGLAPGVPATASAVTRDPAALPGQVQSALIDAIAQQLQLEANEIGRDTQLIELGFDSIRLMAFAARLNRTYGLDVSPAVFFEHRTVREVAGYLLGRYASVLEPQLEAARQRAHTGAAPATVARVDERPRVVGGGAAGGIAPPGGEPIAIIGMSGCFPGARDIDALWDHLAAGRDCISEVPASRWDWRAVFGDPIKEDGKTHVKWGGFIEGLEEFDALFFGISPREAQLMDPQQRLLMIHVWQALEDAGYSPDSLSGSRTGIFVGTLSSGGYAERLVQANVPIEGYTATGATASIGPNRMSYLLDLHGPSEPIETACSSSLVAIHRAVRAMHSGDCEMALVGGVNTIVSPTGHISFSRAGMLSVDGRCKTFSKHANGYARGEGAAILVLKKLSLAERDRDRIHGVILGSAENHGGRASSLTAPNPRAQAEVIKAAHREAGIDPRTISYIETHGTGTPLGDPVEINGLKTAFADLYAASREPGSPAADVAEVHCGLGSVKTNIGHLEIAAGVAGVIKVVLQLQHQTLVKSLHCDDINPFIQLEGSPFYVVQDARPWQALRDRDGRALPRRAGVSSFGFGGVNAHVVIEEYRAAQPDRMPAPELAAPVLIVLSARNADRLRERARDLLAHLDRDGLRDSDLVDIAYTLQIGREAMASRLGFAARSLAQARALLRRVHSGAEQRPDGGAAEIHRGEARRNREAATPAEGGELTAALEAWRARGEHGALLALWVSGRDVDWNQLYGGDPGARPRRVRLPGYPFARERCWIEAPGGPKPDGRPLDSARLHPLLQRNTSTLAQQRFTSTFDGREPFLTDHVVDASKVLPGVAYLEMARAAIERAAARREGCLVLTDVVWMQPLVVGERTEVQIRVSGDEAGPIEIGIHGPSREDRYGQAVIHAQARASWAASAPAPLADLAALQARCERSIDPDRCYAAYRAMKIEYGPAHRGLSAMQLGRDTAGRPFVLAQVALPACVRESAADYVLHPSVLDGAFQATIGLSLDRAGSSPMLPFALERLEILEGTPALAWVFVRPSEAPAGASTQKLDLDVLDGAGRVCVRIRGLTARAVTNQRPSTAPRPSMTTGATTSMTLREEAVMLVPHWEPRVVVTAGAWPAPASRVVLIGGTADAQSAWRSHYPDLEVLSPPADASEHALADCLQRLGGNPPRGIDHLVWLAPASDPSGRGIDDSLIDAQAAGVLALYRLIKALLALGYGSRALGLTVVTAQTQAVVPGEDVAAAHASVHGLVGSLAKEYAGWKIRLLDVPAAGAPAMGEVLRVPADDKGDAWAYRAGEWYRQELVPCELAAPEQPAFRQGGVYVVIGGAGGIGEVLSAYLIRRYQAQMVWIGRRALDGAIQAKIDRLAALGPAPLYLRADATDRAALEAAYRQITARHARITGVVHAAIQLLDRSLAQMDEARFRASLAAKVDIAVRLAQVVSREPLELVLFFSSLQSFAKSAGQSNYAAGCAFKDALAHRLGQDLACAVKVMNWSYWGSVGVVASEAYRARMAKLGVGSIEPDEAMDALERLVAGPRSQAIFLKQTSPELLPQLGAVSERLTQLDGAARLAFDRVPVRNDRPVAVERWHEGLRDMEGLLGRLLLGQLQSLGWFAARSSSILDWQQELGMPRVYGRWMEESVRVLAGLGLAVETRMAVDALWAEWETRTARSLDDPSFRAQARLVEAALRALPEVLTGKRLATDVLFPDSSMELVEGVYKHNVAVDHFNRVLADSLESLLQDRLAQGDDAGIRILEIGAGTGGTTEGVLRRLNLYGRAIAEYCFTDVSKAFLLHAQQEYAPTSPYLVTRIFNVEQPPAAQGLEVGAYDVVIAANVLHATKNIRQTLRHAKAALKRGGALVLSELSGNTLAMHLTFGLLEGWWRYEDPALRVTGAPLLAPDTWDRVLRSEGFGGVIFPAERTHDYGQAIIVAQSDGVIRQAQAATPQALVRPAPSPGGEPLAARAPAAAGSDRDRRTAVRRIILEAIGRALKIDQAGVQDEISFSEYGVDSIVGVSLIKEINESFGSNLPTTALFDYPTLKTLTQHVAEAHGTALTLLADDAVVAAASPPVVVAEAPPRTVRATVAASAGPERFASAGQDIAASAGPERFASAGQDIAASAVHGMYHRLVVRGPGRVEDLEITRSAVPGVGAQEVQIAVAAFSLNFGDLLCAKGLYPTMPPYPFTPGFEISGTVTKVGAAVRSVTRGQRVLALMGENLGGHATVVTCDEAQVTVIPEGLSFEQACALPVVAITMIDAFHKAQLQRGEKILIQTATGGTGLIAVQLAKHQGAEIYATAGSARKVEYLQRLGVAHAINYAEQDFAQEIHRRTSGRGVDVVINTLSGDAIQKGLNCLSSGGRYIEIAMTALKSARNVDLSVLSDNQTFYSVDLRKLARRRPERLAAYRREMRELVERGVIAATVSEVVPFDDVRTAYRRLENRENIGKVVVTVPEAYRHDGIERPRPSAAVTSAVAPAAPGAREPIAIIGMSGRFATADTVAALWDGLAGGVELTDKVTRWPLGEHLAGVVGAGEPYCERGGLLGHIDRFDAEFFHVSGLEAAYMDPHQRLFLEEGWKALEDAGYVGEAIGARRCGVYVGYAGSDYGSQFTDQAPAQAFWGNAGSVISARVSYHLNLVGPAITVDTACSSSLVAVHMACQALWGGEIELGLAGGVHVQCTPAFYVLASRAAMLSPEGRCHAFDARANGFVPGEGVGALVLKRLSDARRDGDHIYGVIRGSGINQDGATNGITAPSARSQEHLEREVYDTFQIRPEEIQLIEAHGTGTTLGDPIEWRALSQAFRHYTQDRQFCAIGSIKTNIGHTAAAAGVAGIIKVLLALAHRQLPPSLHFERGNPHIDFEDSPFFVNTVLRAWDAAARRPRAAAVSSFGFGGTNAHLVIEEAPPAERRHGDRPGYLIVVSAPSAQRLRDQVEQLVRHCAARPALDLGNASFTLVMGRKHFAHRLALAVRDLPELCTRLQAWLDHGHAERVHAGTRSGPGGEAPSREQHGHDSLAACRRGAPADEYLAHLATLAELYVQGDGLAFESLFADDGYARISLPTTRFVPERHWVDSLVAAAPPRAPRGDGRGSPHPLLQHNTSDLTELRFSSTLDGAEFYVNDHVVAGRRVFPGVCYLEMARAAVARGAGTKMAPAGVALHDIVWLRPLVVDGATEVHIALCADGDRALAFEVSSGAGGADGDAQARVVHAQGRARLVEGGSSARQERIELDALRQRVEREIDAGQCYEAFAAMGIVYGAAHRALVRVQTGSEPDGGRFVLAQVALPACVRATRDQFVLHPSVLDGALQATIGLALDGGATRGGPQLPFALERLEILDRTPATAWVVVRPAAARHDLVICDDAGRVCVRIAGLSAKALPRAAAPDGRPVRMVPRWEPTELPEGSIDASEGSRAPAARARVVLVGGTPAQQQAWRARDPRLQVVELPASVEAIAAQLAARGEIDHLIWLAPERVPGGVADDALIAGQEVGVIALYRLIKALLALGYDARRFELTVVTWQCQATVPSERADATHAAVHGLVGSLAKEYEDWKIRLADGCPADPAFLEHVLRVPADPRGDAWVYRAGEWYRQHLIACELDAAPEPPYRRGGVYVVIGGAGGLGEVLSEHVIRTYGARLVWLGRSALTAAIEAKIARLAKLGPAPIYIACDAADRDSLERAYRRIKAEHGQIHGVVHAAIVLRDKSLLQMDEDRFRASLRAKVDVSVRLAQVFAQEPLDFVVFFSSLQSFAKAAGQSNYAAGCVFKDAFANQLARAWPIAVKVINWGYWGSVGIVASEGYRARMAQLGVGSIEPADGMAALDQLLSSPLSQLVLIKTMQPAAEAAETPSPAPRAAVGRPAVAEWSPGAVSHPSHQAEQR